MGFCSCTVKFLMVIFNLAFAIAGIAILVVGVVCNNHGGSFKSLLTGQVTTASIALMVLGAVVFLIAFFGCCGALREDTCMIQTYGVILLVILIVEIAIGITAFVYKGTVVKELNTAGRDFFGNYTKNSKSIDQIQQDLQCCGFDGPNDYPLQLPSSCCSNNTDPCPRRDGYKNGCKELIKNNVKDILAIIGGVAIGIGVVELFGVICAFYVASSIRKEHRRGYA